MELADIMQADVPFVAGPLEDVGVASRHIVPLQNQHSPAGSFGQQCRGGERTDAGADDDDIELAAAIPRAVGMSDFFRGGLTRAV